MEGLKVAGSSSLSDQLFGSLLSRAVDVSPTSLDEGSLSHATVLQIIHIAPSGDLITCIASFTLICVVCVCGGQITFLTNL